jgi:hypothetical protein
MQMENGIYIYLSIYLSGYHLSGYHLSCSATTFLKSNASQMLLFHVMGLGILHLFSVAITEYHR